MTEKTEPKAKARDKFDVDKETEIVLTRKAFIGGRLYEAGETVTALPGIGAAVAKSTPVGNMTIEELEAHLRSMKAKAGLDLDKDGEPGGSMTKAAIAARLHELGVKFDASLTRDELAPILAKAEAEKK